MQSRRRRTKCSENYLIKFLYRNSFFRVMEATVSGIYLVWLHYEEGVFSVPVSISVVCVCVCVQHRCMHIKQKCNGNLVNDLLMKAEKNDNTSECVNVWNGSIQIPYVEIESNGVKMRCDYSKCMVKKRRTRETEE